jgi:hypothetical protein
MSFVGRSDAVVALRSFSRRYSDAIGGPVGEDAWERIVRHQGLGGRSALGHVVAAIAELDALTALLNSVTKTASPSGVSPRTEEPGDHQSIGSLQADVRTAATSAAEALDDRRDSDYEAAVTVDGRELPLGDHVSNVVNRLSAGLRLIEASIESGR